MPFKRFSRRQAELSGTIPDIFEYDIISSPFRCQLQTIIKSTIKEYDPRDEFYSKIVDGFLYELGRDNLNEYTTFKYDDIYSFISETSSTGELLDFVDYFIYFLDSAIKEEIAFCEMRGELEKTVKEINYRLMINNLGYELINFQLQRIDNKVLHQEIVKPALSLISDDRFSGANDEMRSAYTKRREGDNKGAIVEACKAFESTMKTICIIQGYPYAPTAQAKALLDTLKINGYFPTYLEAHMNGIRTTIETGLPTVRNRTSAHGQGQEIVSLPDAYVDYAINLLATNIVFLVKLLNA